MPSVVIASNEKLQQKWKNPLIKQTPGELKV